MRVGLRRSWIGTGSRGGLRSPRPRAAAAGAAALAPMPSLPSPRRGRRQVVERVGGRSSDVADAVGERAVRGRRTASRPPSPPRTAGPSAGPSLPAASGAAASPPSRGSCGAGSPGLQRSCAAAVGWSRPGTPRGRTWAAPRSSLMPGWFGPSQVTQRAISRKFVVVPPSAAIRPARRWSRRGRQRRLRTGPVVRRRG